MKAVTTLDEYLLRCSRSCIERREIHHIPELRYLFDSHPLFDIFQSTEKVYLELTLFNNERSFSSIDCALSRYGAVALIKVYSGHGTLSSRRTQEKRKRSSLLLAKEYLAEHFSNEIQRQDIFEFIYNISFRRSRYYQPLQ